MGEFVAWVLECLIHLFIHLFTERCVEECHEPRPREPRIARALLGAAEFGGAEQGEHAARYSIDDAPRACAERVASE